LVFLKFSRRLLGQAGRPHSYMREQQQQQQGCLRERSMGLQSGWRLSSVLQ
jgi:hypothetical protein